MRKLGQLAWPAPHAFYLDEVAFKGFRATTAYMPVLRSGRRKAIQAMNETDLLTSHTEIKSKRMAITNSSPSPSELQVFRRRSEQWANNHVFVSSGA